MKSKFVQVLVVFLVLSLILSACGKKQNDDQKQEEDVFFTVTFDSNGGTSVETQSVKKDGKADSPTNPIKDGFNFKGWYQGVNQFEFASPITADITLCAMWIQTFTVSFDSKGGSGIASQTIELDMTADRPSNPAMVNFRFLGWFASEDGGVTLFDEEYDFQTKITADLILYAKWQEIIRFTVSYESNGGSEVEPQFVEENKFATKPISPKRDRYYFINWFTSDDGGETLSSTAFDFNTPIVGNITLYAAWEAKVYYTVTLENGRFVSGASLSGEVEKGYSCIIGANMPPINKLFSHWENQNGEFISDLMTITITVNSNMTLRAVYKNGNLATPSLNAARFNTNGSLEIERGGILFFDYLTGGEIVYPIPELDYLKIYLYASYNSEILVGEFGVYKNRIFALDSELEFVADVTVASGYGWQNSGNYYFFTNDFEVFLINLLGDDYDDSGYYIRSQFVVKSDVDYVDSSLLSELSANFWKPADRVVTFDTRGGELISSVSLPKGEYLTRPADPVKANNVFVGWYTSSDGGLTLDEEYDFELPILLNTTIYAKWQLVDDVDLNNKIEKPSSGVLSFNASGTFQIERGGANELIFSNHNVDYVLVTAYVENSSGAEVKFSFKLFANTLESLDGKVYFVADMNANEGYNDQRSGNYYIYKADVLNFFRQILGDEYENYSVVYFRTQIIAREGTGFFDSELSDFSSAYTIEQIIE